MIAILSRHGQDYLKDIEVLVRAHSRHYHTYDETLDLDYDPYLHDRDRLLKYPSSDYPGDGCD